VSTARRQLDLDRLRRAGEIVDHVRQDLHDSMRMRGGPSETLPVLRRSREDVAGALAAWYETRHDVSAVLAVANSPSSAPVRRDVPAISGVAATRAGDADHRFVSSNAVPPGVQ